MFQRQPAVKPPENFVFLHLPVLGKRQVVPARCTNYQLTFQQQTTAARTVFRKEKVKEAFKHYFLTGKYFLISG
jgi:hypothetical protein